MEKCLVLVDAYPLIYRSYYAMKDSNMTNSKGENVSIPMGFVRTLDLILKNYSPTHIAVVFDNKAPTFRHLDYPEYKAQREAAPEDIHKSVPLIEEIVDAYNIKRFSVEGYEADDVVGTLARMGESEGFNVLMFTPDKDYAQLVTENVRLIRINHKGMFDEYDVRTVCEKWGLSSPEQVIDLLALMGDASDNIPGCKGVGEKTAVKLLNDFGNVENLIEKIDTIKGALKEKVRSSVEDIKMSKYLATIVRDVPMEFSFDELEYKKSNDAELLNFYKKHEMYSLAKKLSQSVTTEVNLFTESPSKIESENEYQNLSELKTVDHTYKLIENQTDIDDLVALLEGQEKFCFDTETTSTDVFSANLVGMSFCWKEGEAYFVLLPTNREESEKIVEKFRPVFENERVKKIGQNMKFDILMLRQYNVEVKGELFDTMIAHYLLQPEQRHGMDYLSEVYLKYKTITYEELTSKNRLSLRQVDKNFLSDYACEDADVTLKLKNVFEKELEAKGLRDLFYNVEMPLMLVLADMEESGVRIDTNSLAASSVEMNEYMKTIEEEIYKLAGERFNIGSTRQVGEILYGKLCIEGKAKKTKTGQFSTKEDVLLKLRTKHPIVDKILDYRGVKKLLSTYIDALPEMVNMSTGKIHTSFNQTVTSTGRLSSSNPNLQNIPIREEMGRQIRKSFVADEECKFLSADYSQIELRVMAHASEDQSMIEAFCSDYDFHQSTAAKIYHISPEEVTKEMRSKAKTANFGILYGISAFGLSERLSISRGEASELIKDYFSAFPQVQMYIESVKDFAHTNEYVETIFGRRRYINDINSRNGTLRQNAERNAVNAPIQGSAADIIKMAMVNIHNRIKREGLKSQMIIQVHDELNFNVPNEEVDIMTKLVVEEMENVVKLKVPLKVECGVSDNWLGAH